MSAVPGPVKECQKENARGKEGLSRMRDGYREKTVSDAQGAARRAGEVVAGVREAVV